MSRPVSELLRRGRGEADPDADPDTDPGLTRRSERKAARAYRSTGHALPFRFATLLLAMAYSLGAPRVGVEPGTVALVLGLAAAFLGVDTLRPSGMVRE